MYDRFVLEDGREVETPLLDGILERAMHLVKEWVNKDRSLESVPYHVLLLDATGCADSARVLKELQKGAVEHDDAFRKAHSHLPEILMLAGVAALLGVNTWCLESKSRDLTAPPQFRGLKEYSGDATSNPVNHRLTERELRESKEFKVDLPEAFGKNASEHLLQAVLAYDRWVRKAYSRKKEVYSTKDMEK